MGWGRRICRRLDIWPTLPCFLHHGCTLIHAQERAVGSHGRPSFLYRRPLREESALSVLSSSASFTLCFLFFWITDLGISMKSGYELDDVHARLASLQRERT